MSMKTLNRLLGWSMLDPKISQAYSEDRIDEILVEYGFSDEERRQLREVKTNSFNEFASVAYRIVEAIEGEKRHLRIPSPMEGLQPDSGISEKGQVA
jgi:hypothetical protein